MTRKPVRQSYDARVGTAVHRDVGYFAYVLVKFNYGIASSSPTPLEAEPLLHDFNDETLDPRLRPATDFWPMKQHSDFVVTGSAFAPPGQPVASMSVSASVGRHSKTIDVMGRREIRWDAGHTPRIGAPQPFEEMPLTYENAYGGIDWRVTVPDMKSLEVQAAMMTDHPGLYPRNPFGKGYLVLDGEVDDMEMPNLEDPADPLTAERLLVGDPEHWYKQPLPCCFDWTHPATFPRYLFLGNDVDAWYPAPSGEMLPEVARGLLPQDYRDILKLRQLSSGPDLRFYQGGSHGLILPRLAAGEPITLSGMHPEKPTQSFDLPQRSPEIVLIVDGQRKRPATQIFHVVCHPAEERITVVYQAAAPLDRVLLNGVHKVWPIEAQIDGDAPIVCEVKTPALEQLRAADPDGQAAKMFPNSPASQVT